ncbi:MAG: hypothetical protein K5652_04780 [Bacteroidales bacterium]|nr:hypothetical protein [Bacteroidales bacterium]
MLQYEIKRYPTIRRAITQYAVQKAAPKMGGVTVHIQVPDISEVRHNNGCNTFPGRQRWFSKESPEEPGTETSTGLCQHQADQHMISPGRRPLVQKDTNPQPQRIILHRSAGHPFNGIWREFLPGLRFWRMLAAQPSKAVVSRHEQIVTGNPRLAVERRPVRLDTYGIVVPLILEFWRQLPPRFKGTKVHCLMLHL